ncbi:glycosyltransferase [Stenotrophomonas maltophilia]|uniref:glycosyltransferase n=2 Tax=Bacteria TaxID=2 RepID=UPI0022F3918E|nr:glycosyltransferase [Stenotrophomonas maltophilia]MDA5343710.1 glycosyltransferase [Stenotrophomonas maltophilia]
MNIPSAENAAQRRGSAALGLLAWIRRQLWLQPIYRLLPAALRGRIASALKSRTRRRLQFRKTPAWSQQSANTMPAAPSARSPSAARLGVDMFGFIRGQFGLGESARMYARALIESGAAVTLHDVDLGLPHGWDDRSLEAYMGQPPAHDVAIVCVNPDCFAEALAKIGRDALKGKLVVGCWFWELETVPETWLPALAHVDAIMVASTFIETAFRKVTDKPIIRVPLPLSAVPDSGLQREDFGLDERSFVFLTTFDFNSHVARKNPLAAVAAFRAAFPLERDDVRLVVKSSNGQWHDEGLRALLQAAGGDPRIMVRDEVIDRAHVRALQRCCDAYVSLHRAEGFGLGLAECMEMGKPVIATGWSGNMEFMSDRNACLVDFALIPVAEGEYPGAVGALWADVVINSAAEAMLALASSAQHVRDVGRRAQRDVRETLSPARAGDAIIRQLGSLIAIEKAGRSSFSP